MDFALTDDQEMLRASAREFLTRQCPAARVREAAEHAEGHSESLDREIAAMGWNGILVPEAYGGLGLGVLDAAVLLTELGSAAAPGPFLFSSILSTALLVQFGSAAQRKRWLPPLSSGTATATIAWLEASDRLDAAGIETVARERGRHYVLRGQKLFVPFAGRADLLIVVARTAGGPADGGVTLFLVPAQAPGLRIRPLDNVDRTRPLYAVNLGGVETEPSAILGKRGRGSVVLDRMLDLAAVAVAADSLGGSDRVLEMSVAYSRTREQFGRPIGSFQAIKHIAAEMVTDIEPGRSLLWYAAYAQDAKLRDASRAASMAKAYLCDVYSRSADRGVQIHGGIGFTWEHDVHFWFKRAKWNELAFGDVAFHRERIARLGGY